LRNEQERIMTVQERYGQFAIQRLSTEELVGLRLAVQADRHRLKSGRINHLATLERAKTGLRSVKPEGEQWLARTTSAFTRKFADGPSGHGLGIAIDRVIDGKRVEGWALPDSLELLQQLGATVQAPAS
jgi:hypothetical protein